MITSSAASQIWEKRTLGLYALLLLSCQSCSTVGSTQQQVGLSHIHLGLGVLLFDDMIQCWPLVHWSSMTFIGVSPGPSPPPLPPHPQGEGSILIPIRGGWRRDPTRGHCNPYIIVLLTDEFRKVQSDSLTLNQLIYLQQKKSKENSWLWIWNGCQPGENSLPSHLQSVEQLSKFGTDTHPPGFYFILAPFSI